MTDTISLCLSSTCMPVASTGDSGGGSGSGAALTAPFGADTPAGQGAWQPLVGGVPTAISAYGGLVGGSLGTYSVDISGGRLKFTGGGNGAPNGAVLSLTAGGQIYDVTIGLIAGRRDAATQAEFDSAWAETGDGVIALREGLFLDGTPGTTNIGTLTSLYNDRRVILKQKDMATALNDPNSGQAYTAWAGDANAIASFTGSHVEITCDTPAMAGFSGQCHIYNVNGLLLTNLDLRYTTYTDQYFRTENGVAGATSTEASTTQADASGCLVVFDGIGGATGTESAVIVRNCRLGGALAQANWDHTTSDTKRYVHGIYAQNGGKLVVEDCVIWGTYQVGKIARMKTTVLRRNLFRGQADRGLVCFVNDESGYDPVYEVYNNALADVISQADWRASHFDFMQFGVGAAEKAANFDVYVARNHIDQSAIVTYGANGETKDTHGLVGTGNSSNPDLRGVVENNIIVQSGIEADSWKHLAASQPGDASHGLILRNNTFVKQVRYDTPASAGGNPAYPCRQNAQVTGTKKAENNIVGTLAGTCTTASGIVGARHNLQSSRPDWESSSGITVYPYDEIFAGPFTWNSGQGRWEADDMANYDTSSRVSVKSWLDTVFAAKAGGPGTGKGHLA